MLTIKPTDDIVELGKRTNLPFITSSPCPQCAEVLEVSLVDDHYLNYPIVGKPAPIWFYCSVCNCNWTHEVILRVSLEIVP